MHFKVIALAAASLSSFVAGQSLEDGQSIEDLCASLNLGGGGGGSSESDSGGISLGGSGGGELDIDVISDLDTDLSTDEVNTELENDFTPDSVSAVIDTASDLFQDTVDIVTSFNPIGILTAVPRFLNNVRLIITTVASDVNAFLNVDLSDPFPEDGQSKIFDAFGKFVSINIELLEGIVSRAGMLAITPFTAPIAALVRVLEQGIDAFLFGIIALIPEFEVEAQEQKAELDSQFSVVIERFD